MNQWPPHAYAATYLCTAAAVVLSALVLRGVVCGSPVAPAAAGAAPLAPPIRSPHPWWCASPALWWPCCAAWSATC